MNDDLGKKDNFQDAISKRLHENYDKHVEETNTQNIISGEINEPDDVLSFLKKHNEFSDKENIKKYVGDVLQKKGLKNVDENDFKYIINHLEEIIKYVNNPISDALSFGEKVDGGLAGTTKALNAICSSMQKFGIFFHDFGLDVDFFKKYVKDWNQKDIDSMSHGADVSDYYRRLFLPVVYAYCETHDKSLAESGYPLEKDFDKDLKLNPAGIVNVNWDQQVSNIVLSQIDYYNNRLRLGSMKTKEFEYVSSIFNILKVEKFNNLDDFFAFLLQNNVVSFNVLPQEEYFLKNIGIAEHFVSFYDKNFNFIQNSTTFQNRWTSLLGNFAKIVDSGKLVYMISKIKDTYVNDCLRDNKNIPVGMKEELFKKEIN